MQDWQISILGSRSFAAAIEEDELIDFFTFSEEEIDFINKHRAAFRIPLAFHIGFLRLTGTHPEKAAAIPEFLLAHFSTALGWVPGTATVLQDFYSQRPRTMLDHQAEVRTLTGWRSFSDSRLAMVAADWLDRATLEPCETNRLVVQFRIWLYENRILIVSTRRIRSLISKAYEAKLRVLHRALSARYTSEFYMQWHKRLRTEAHDKLASFNRLRKIVAQRDNIRASISELHAIAEFLYLAGVAKDWPDIVHSDTVAQFALRYASRSFSQCARTTSSVLMLEVICFLRYALCCVVDLMLEQMCEWAARAKAAAESAADIERSGYASSRTFASFVLGLSSDLSRPAAETYPLLHAMAKSELKRLTASRGDRVRALLMERASSVRAVLSRIVQLDFASVTENSVIEAIHILRDVYRRRGTELPREVGYVRTSGWRGPVADVDRRRALLAFEWATLFDIRSALIHGALWAENSSKFSCRRDELRRLARESLLEVWGATVSARADRHQGGARYADDRSAV